MATPALTALPPPITDPLIEFPKGGKPTGMASWTWIQYFLTLSATVANVPIALRKVSKVNQSASLAPVGIPLASVAPGLYLISWYFRVKVADGVSSSLSVTISFTDGGVACTKTGAAEIGNTTGTFQGASQLIRSDQNSPILFSTTYISGGGGPAMVYDLDIVAQQINA